MRRFRPVVPLLLALMMLLIGSQRAAACPSCFGAPDAPATHGMNMAIIALLGVTGSVLMALGSLFLRIRKRILGAESHQRFPV